MYALVADLHVRLSGLVVGGPQILDRCLEYSYRIKKHVDVCDRNKCHISLQLSTAINGTNNMYYSGEGNFTMHDYSIMEDRDINGHLYHHLVKDDILISLIPKYMRGHETQIHIIDMLTLKDEHLVPERYATVIQYIVNNPGLTYFKQNQIKPTLMPEFLERFNNAGRSAYCLQGLEEKLDNVETKHREDIDELKRMQEVSIDRLTGALVETRAENQKLKREVRDLQKVLRTVLKDISYLKTVTPMIEL